MENLLRQQSITNNSVEDNFLNLIEEQRQKEYDEITEKLESSKSKLAESESRLMKKGFDSLNREVVRNVHQFYKKTSDGIVLSDDELRERLWDGLKNNPDLKEWYGDWSKKIEKLKIERKTFWKDGT